MILGVIGCGKMASALVEGFSRKKELSFAQILLRSRGETSSKELAQTLCGLGEDASPASDTPQLISAADVILLAVKPPQVEAVLRESNQWGSGKLLISVAAGITTSSLAQWSSDAARIARVMPNTPSLIQEGASAFCMNEHATAQDRTLLNALLGAAGKVEEVEETLMNAVTGLSGSGPAYVYTIIEALSDAGVLKGLPRTTALNLAVQTVKGAAMMVEQTGLHPALLREAVTSPGGTTIAGLTALEEHGVRRALSAAVQSAAKRAAELGG